MVRSQTLSLRAQERWLRGTYGKGARVALALVLAACASDVPVAPLPATNGATMFWALRLSAHGITLSTEAPYDTITLTATPVNDVGQPLSGLPAVTWTSTDIQHAQVSPQGVVTALQPGSEIDIVASVFRDNILHSDTAVLTITDTTQPPVLGALSIQPVPPDSAKIDENDTKSLAAVATSTTGDTLNGLSIYYESSDPTVATIDRETGFLSPTRPGRVTLKATATAYGVTMSDTVTYVVGYPILIFMQAIPQVNAQGQTVYGFNPSPTVGVGANLVFFNPFTPIDVVFDDPANVAAGTSAYCAFIPCDSGGNIAAFSHDQDSLSNAPPPWGVRLRSFQVPGVYHYHSVLQGTSGTITVVQNPAR